MSCHGSLKGDTLHFYFMLERDVANNWRSSSSVTLISWDCCKFHFYNCSHFKQLHAVCLVGARNRYADLTLWTPAVGDGPVLHSRVPFAANNLSPTRIKQTLILHIPERSPPSCSLRLQQKPQSLSRLLIIDLVSPCPASAPLPLGVTRFIVLSYLL